MNREQEYFIRFGVLMAFIIITYAVSSFERAMIKDELLEIKTMLKDR